MFHNVLVLKLGMVVPLPQMQRMLKVSGFEYVESQQKVRSVVSLPAKRVVDSEVFELSFGGGVNAGNGEAVSFTRKQAS